MDVLVYAAVLTPVLPALVPEPLYVARWDIVNELYGWDEVAAAVRERLPAGGVVVAGHYTMCAQLEWNLRGSGIPVACWTEQPSDFELWRPGERTTAGRPVLFVSDERYPERPCDGGAGFPGVGTVVVERGGAAVRRFLLTECAAGGVVWPRPPHEARAPGERVPCGGRPTASD